MNTAKLNLLDPDQETLRLRKANADKRMKGRMAEALASAHRSDEADDTVFQALR